MNMKVRKWRLAAAFFTIMAVVPGGNSARAQLTKLPDKTSDRSAAHLYERDALKTLKQAPAAFQAPVYANNVISTKYGEVNSVKGLHTTMAIIRTSDSPTTAMQWYETAIPSYGWQVDPHKETNQGMTQYGELQFLRARKEGLILTLSCLRPPNFKETCINLSVSSR